MYSSNLLFIQIHNLFPPRLDEEQIGGGMPSDKRPMGQITHTAMIIP